ncbi:MAG: hypothetical protein JWN30_737 [Bacilli bacterium]|nr:hypothetical protein [Bacilli bacterium]
MSRMLSKFNPLYKGKEARFISTAVLFLAGISLILLFFYFDRQDTVSVVLRSWGTWGILLSIALMAFLSIMPVPSEFLLILNMKIYGVVSGILYAWIGTMAGTLLTFIIIRFYGMPLLKQWVSEAVWIKVDRWVSKRGAIGLLIARLLPIPASVVNYAAGCLESVRLWDYFWTAAVSIWPYYLGAASLFVGIPKGITKGMLLGGAILLVLWLVGSFLNRKTPN